jgi:DNA repair photolyase
MDNEEKEILSEELENAVEARRLSQHPFIIEFFKNMEQALWLQFKSSHPDNGKERERIYLQMTLLEEFKNHFSSAIDDGSIALEDIQKMLQEAENGR